MGLDDSAESGRYLSRSSRTIVEARKLQRGRVRRQVGLCLADGPQSVEYGLRARLVKTVFVTDDGRDRFAEIVEGAIAQEVIVHGVDDQTMSALSDTRAPQGILGICAIPNFRSATDSRHGAGDAEALREALRSAKLAVLLERCQDPGNVGTIIRTADAAGVDLIVLGPGTADPFSEKCLRSSAGSAFGVSLMEVADVHLAVQDARDAGLCTRATSGRADRTLVGQGAIDAAARCLWVFGNEAHGVSEALIDACDEAVSIPMFGQAESLNVAVAATLAMYESALAQRGIRQLS